MLVLEAGVLPSSDRTVMSINGGPVAPASQKIASGMSGGSGHLAAIHAEGAISTETGQ